MYNCKKDNNNKDKNSSNKFLGKAFNLRLVTCKKATIIRYRY
jgi:hypothetical protein